MPDCRITHYCAAHSTGCGPPSHCPTGLPRTCHQLPPLLPILLLLLPLPLLPPPLQVAVEIQLKLGQRTAGASVLQQVLQGNDLCRTEAQGGGAVEVAGPSAVLASTLPQH